MKVPIGIVGYHMKGIQLNISNILSSFIYVAFILSKLNGKM